MAIIDPRTKKKLQEEDSQGSTLPQASSTGIIGGANTQTLSNNPGTAGNDPANKPRSGSGFTNLGQYAQANQGRGQKLVDTVNQNVKSKFKDNLVGQAKSAADTAINKGGDLNQINQINSQLQSGNYSGINKDAFNKAISSSYGGPGAVNKIKEVADAGTAINKQLQDAQRLNTPSNRGLLIRDAFNKGGYTRGGGNLDSFIYGQADSSESKNILDRAKADQEAYEQMTQGLAGTIGDRQKAIQQAVTQLQSNYNTARTDTQASVQDMLANAQQQALNANAAQNKKYNDLIENKNFDVNQDGIVDNNDRYLMGHLADAGLKFDWNKLVNRGGGYTQGNFIDKNKLDNLTTLLGLKGEANPFTISADNIGKNTEINNDLVKTLGDLTLALNQDKARKADWFGKTYNLPPTLDKVRYDFENKSREHLKDIYGLSDQQVDYLDRYEKKQMDDLFQNLKVQKADNFPTNPEESAMYSRSAKQALQLNNLLKALGIEGKTYDSRIGSLWDINRDSIGDRHLLDVQLNPLRDTAQNPYQYVREGVKGFKPVASPSLPPDLFEPKYGPRS